MILLSFNIIHPEISEKNVGLVSEEELLKVTSDGTLKILEILEKNMLQATFFVEISLVEKLPELLKIIVKKGHELSLLNKNSYQSEIEKAKLFAEELTGKSVRGLRQFPEKRVNSEMVKKLGFIYRSPLDLSLIHI